MDEYMNEEGELLPERRSQIRSIDVELQQAIYQLTSKVEIMSNNLDTKLDAVDGKISNLDSKISLRVDVLEDKLKGVCEDGEEVDVMLRKHDKDLDKMREYADKIKTLENDVRELKIEKDKQFDTLNKELNLIKDQKDKSIMENVKEFFKVFRNVLFTAIATGIVGLIFYYIFQYIKK